MFNKAVEPIYNSCSQRLRVPEVSHPQKHLILSDSLTFAHVMEVTCSLILGTIFIYRLKRVFVLFCFVSKMILEVSGSQSVVWGRLEDAGDSFKPSLSSQLCHNSTKILCDCLTLIFSQLGCKVEFSRGYRTRDTATDCVIIQLSSIKPDIKEICKNGKAMPLFQLLLSWKKWLFFILWFNHFIRHSQTSL